MSLLRRRSLLALAPALLATGPARANALRVLSAGAVEPGLELAVAGFRAARNAAVEIRYATAPQLRERILGGEVPDLLIAPVALVNELVAAGRLADERAAIGKVGAGIVVKPGGWEPAVGDAEALKRAVEQASAVVFNRASTGMTMERIFERWGMTAAVNAKAVRFATGAEVLERLLAGSGDELGFAAITEIHLVPALRYLGPLPEALQVYTTYAATLLPGHAPEAAELLRWLTGADGRAALEKGGVEAAG
jgi:molybdate transport system substrate-binding protein